MLYFTTQINALQPPLNHSCYLDHFVGNIYIRVEESTGELVIQIFRMTMHVTASPVVNLLTRTSNHNSCSVVSDRLLERVGSTVLSAKDFGVLPRKASWKAGDQSAIESAVTVITSEC
ncbi:hypothetical protein AVEN_10829-1 [Araneus ventricosus]|uniref:Uncharacterized protein n=1 Tax=Araneus ventricosus TaxID=182803 RepID=A0A4Y2NN12_ARAVE|nr:hypothetical protein AVEN_10829-1 [Araneus ventricosus]